MNKEYNILSYFNFRALFMGIGLSTIIINSNKYYYISIILGTIFGILFLLANNYKNKNKIINTISNYIIYIITFIILTNMISTMYLTNTSILYICIPIIFLLIYLLSKKEIIIYRLSNILLVINLSLFILTVLTLFEYLDFSNYNYVPFNINKIIISSIEYALLSTTPIIVTKNNNIDNKNIIKSYIISSLTMLIIFFFTYTILGYQLINIYRYPEYIILKKVSITSAIQNIENLVSFMWLIDIFMLMSTSLNKIKYTINNNKILYILIITSIIPIIYISKYYQLIISIYKYTPIIFLLLFIFAFIKEKRT